MNYRTIPFLLLLTIFTQVNAQPRPNKYGLQVIKKVKDYKFSVEGDASKQLVDIRSYIPGIVLELRYKSSGNFTGAVLYPYPATTYLRVKAAENLLRVQQSLNKKGLALKIWDAYRPYSVTEKMWKIVKDDRYAADPKKGSGHNRGVAVDLTIIRLDTGLELDMGTSFDNFSDTAHHSFPYVSDAVKSNRKLLKELMIENGFLALDSEWWHYYLQDFHRYELLDLSFKNLDRISR